RDAPDHRLEDQTLPRQLRDLVQRVERVPQMVEDPHEEHIVETRAEEIDVVHVQPPELDVQTVHLGREPRLSQVSLVVVDAQDPGPTPTETLSVEPRVAPDVQDRRTRQVLGEMPPDVQPDLLEEVAERMVRCRPNPMPEVDVVEPGPQFRHPGPELRDPQRPMRPRYRRVHGRLSTEEVNSTARTNAAPGNFHSPEIDPRTA